MPTQNCGSEHWAREVCSLLPSFLGGQIALRLTSRHIGSPAGLWTPSGSLIPALASPLPCLCCCLPPSLPPSLPARPQVFAFDPTVDDAHITNLFRKNHNKAVPAGFRFRQIGLSDTDGVVTFRRSSNKKVQVGGRETGRAGWGAAVCVGGREGGREGL